MPTDDDTVCCCHVKTATWIIAIVQFVVVVLAIVVSVIAIISPEAVEGSAAPTIIYMVAMVIWFLLIGLLIVGLMKNRANFILPHLFVSVIMFILDIIRAVLMFIQAFNVANLIVYILVAIFILFCLWIEWRCYKYLRA